MDPVAHSPTDSICCASFGVCSYLSAPFAAEWNVLKGTVYPRLEITCIYAANGAMNGGHAQRDGTTLCLRTSPASDCSIILVVFKCGDTEPAGSPDLSPIDNVESMHAQRLDRVTQPAVASDHIWTYVKAVWMAVPPRIYPRPL
ncbi:hypothetical protein TNCV_2761291 [Trichonephila clavipes]|nr:hypothetical protein TNCV_2761291 [Trichonephila clavipes]